MKQQNTIQLYCRQNNIDYLSDEPMCKHTTFHIGGTADLFIKPTDTQQLSGLLSYCTKNNILPFFIGKGSNLLVNDDGIRGVVISTSYLDSEIEMLNETTIRCTAGTDLAQLCMFAYKHSLTGLEFAWGIPGSVGGAIYMNAGAYGSEMKDVLLSSAHIDKFGTEHITKSNKLKLSYRHSIYAEDNSILITHGVFKLQVGSPETIRNAMDTYKTKRRTSQPLELPSAGSTFKRPATGYASALIDECGLKGLTVGGAMVSTKHAGF
ncbi:MAG: UDP-N-acetylmuramate dehydrogenase, partial [Oscillospiraceae bacterium]